MLVAIIDVKGDYSRAARHQSWCGEWACGPCAAWWILLVGGDPADWGLPGPAITRPRAAELETN